MGFELRTDVMSWGRVVRCRQLVAGPAFRDEVGDVLGARPRGVAGHPPVLSLQRDTIVSYHEPLSVDKKIERCKGKDRRGCRDTS